MGTLPQPRISLVSVSPSTRRPYRQPRLVGSSASSPSKRVTSPSPNSAFRGLWTIIHLARERPTLYFAWPTWQKKAGRADALDWFLQVTFRYPGTPEAELARFRVARLQTATGELDLACENFKAVKENPKAAIEVRAEAAALEGMAHLQKWYKTRDEAELEAAITTLESVQQQFPKETKGVAWSRFRLGLFYIHEGRNVQNERLRNNPARGREILEDAIRNLPHNYFTWWMKAELATGYLPEKRYADVVAQCKSLLSEQPPASWKAYIMYILGDCQIRLGSKDEGMATLRQLVKELPKSQWADVARGRLRSLAE